MSNFSEIIGQRSWWPERAQATQEKRILLCGAHEPLIALLHTEGELAANGYKDPAIRPICGAFFHSQRIKKHRR